MKTIIAAIAATAGLATLSPATAEPLAPKPVSEAAASDAAPAPVAKPQRVCFLYDVTGSHIQRKECRSRAEWKAMDVQIPAGR